MIRHAVAYAERLGWPVLPLHSVRTRNLPNMHVAVCSCVSFDRDDCHSPGKHPRLQHGVLEATTDMRQIREWWQRWPDANIGIAGGEQWWALDVDGSEGENQLAKLEDEHGWKHEGPIAISGSGGRHYFFAADARVGNRVRFARGLDTRSAGGYLVAAPSNHASGDRYRWLAPPRQQTMTPAPSWLVELVSQPAQRFTSRPPPPPITDLSNMADRARCYIAGCEGGKRGCGNGVGAKTFRVAQILVRRFGLPRDQAYLLLDEWSHAHCSPPWTMRELNHKLDDAERQGKMPVGIENRPRQ